MLLLMFPLLLSEELDAIVEELVEASVVAEVRVLWLPLLTGVAVATSSDLLFGVVAVSVLRLVILLYCWVLSVVLLFFRLFGFVDDVPVVVIASGAAVDVPVPLFLLFNAEFCGCVI